MSTVSEATQILFALSGGDRTGAHRLMELVYDELRKLAFRYLRPRALLEPLQPTELVHEAFLRLVDKSCTDWRGRSHFFAVAATVMRHILVDEARSRASLKRGGGQVHLSVNEEFVLSVERDHDVLAVNGALEALEKRNPERAHLVEMRFFGGMTMDEVAEATGRPKRTVERDWTVTRAWLRRELSRGREG